MVKSGQTDTLEMFDCLSNGTRRTYIHWWTRWNAWASERDYPVKPAVPANVVEFLRILMSEDKGQSSVRGAISAISRAHADLLPSPLDGKEIRDALGLFSRERSTRRRPGWASIIANCMNCKVSRVGSDTAEGKRALVDIALAYLVYEEGFPYTEVAGLTWGDCDAEESILSVTLSRGERRRVPVASETMIALTVLKPLQVDSTAPIFASSRHGGARALSLTQLSRRLAKAATESSLSPSRRSV